MTDKEFDYMFLPIKADKDLVREIEEIQSYLTDKVAESEQAVKEFAEKLKDYITDLAVEEFGDCACDMQYLTINIDDFADKIDELLKEYEE